MIIIGKDYNCIAPIVSIYLTLPFTIYLYVYTCLYLPLRKGFKSEWLKNSVRFIQINKEGIANVFPTISINTFNGLNHQ